VGKYSKRKKWKSRYACNCNTIFSKREKEIRNPQSKLTPPMKPSPFPRTWQGIRFPKNRDTRAPKCAISTMLTREHSHKMHPVYRPPIPKTQTQKVTGIEGKEPAFPTIPMKRSEGPLTHPQRFDQGGKKEKQKTKMRPVCRTRSIRTAFWPIDTPVHEAARSVFLEEQLVARCNPDFSRVKEIRKEKAAVREKELESRENRRKHQPVYVVLQNPELNAIAVLKQTRTLNVQVNCCKQSISSCFEGWC
jgi:hypothetical protein